MILTLDSVAPSKSGKSLLVKCGSNTYFAKTDSGLSAGMTIEAETKDSEYQGKTLTWIERWKDAPASAQKAPSAPAMNAGAPWYLPFVSNTVAHAIAAGLIKEPHDILPWAHGAKAAALEEIPNMSKFKVGQRVRINCPHSSVHGMEATIWAIRRGNWAEGTLERWMSPTETAYRVNVDGVGKHADNGWDYRAFPAYRLLPLTDPGFDAFMEKVMKPIKEPVMA
jgi:hypothetical protein